MDMCVCVCMDKGELSAGASPDDQDWITPLSIGTGTPPQGIGEAFPDYIHGESEGSPRANRLLHILQFPGEKRPYLQVAPVSFPLPWTKWNRMLKSEWKSKD